MERIREAAKDRRGTVMMLVEGRIDDYEKMMRSPVETYITAFELYVRNYKSMQPKKNDPMTNLTKGKKKR